MTGYSDTPSLFSTQEPHPPCSHRIEVVFDSAADTTFTYLVPDALGPVVPGQRVEAPLGKGNHLQIAFCVALADDCASQGFTLKAIRRVVDHEPLLDSHLLGLARWISEYYCCPLGQVLAAVVPGPVKRSAGMSTERYLFQSPEGGGGEAAGQKQRLVLALLRDRKASDQESALSMVHVLSECGCTEQPVKALAQKGLIRIVTRTGWSRASDLPRMPGSREDKGFSLNEDQERALAHILQELQRRRFGVSVLHGVTDSGKTEVYIRAIQRTIELGKSAIVLVPEIALTAQTVQRFMARLGDVAVLHSGLTAAQRSGQWRRIRSGDVKVVVGARSAVFAPVADLGLIVVDEEHEPSYKQDSAPRYHGRDLAIKRAQLASAQCILGSATPSLETLVNCRQKRFSLLRLPKRVMDLPMPGMRLVDLRQDPAVRSGESLISGPLAARLIQTLDKKEQVILLLNRRGYSHFVFCPSCKHTLRCRNCDVNLTFHKTTTSAPANLTTVTGRHLEHGVAVCHYCMAQTLVPQKCPLCGKRLALIGLGAQRLEEELRHRFPQARVARIDSDSMSGNDYARTLQAFGDGHIDILAGTQMLAKGLHFPNVTLVGIISADTSLYVPDFRANERTFQLICQVAGRAGRSAKSGTVFVQTFLPDQPAIQFALKDDFEGFVQEELKHRQACNLPPFWRLALIGLRCTRYERLEAAAAAAKEQLDQIIAAEGLTAKVRGPMPATISRIQRSHRMQILVQAPDTTQIQRLFRSLRAKRPIRPAVTITVDIDPVNLL